jgi:very-short-patch-repair endonuclease
MSESNSLVRPYGSVTYQCEFCGKEKTVTLSTYKMSKHHFCGNKCAVDSGVCNVFMDRKVSSGRRTNIESIVEQFLIEHDIHYKFEFHVWRYYIDFAIREKMIAIECDGIYWHSKPGCKEKDNKKDKFLASKGWTVIRLSEKAINDGTFKDSLLSLDAFSGYIGARKDYQPG